MLAERYQRQMLLPEIGRDGQEKLSRARVAVVGLGGLGCPAAQYLAAAGIGTLTLIDGDRVQASNLPRQILFGAEDCGKNKAAAAGKQLARLNDAIDIRVVERYLTPDNARRLLEKHDMVIDGSDNFPTRYLINDVCVGLDMPFVFAGLDRFQWQVMVCNVDGGATYRCLFPNMPDPDTAPSCSETGMLGVVSGMAGLALAHRVLHYVLHLPFAAGRLMITDMLTLQTTEMTVAPQEKQRRVARQNFERLPAVSYDFQCDRQLEWRPQQLEERLAHIQVIDIRESAEPPLPWPALWLPVSELSPADIPGDKECVLVCRYGTGSRRMARWLRENGLSRVYSLHGGVHALENFYIKTES